MESHGVPECCVVAAIGNYSNQVDEEVNGASLRKLKRYLMMGKNGVTITGEPTPLAFLIHFVGDIHQPLHVGFGCDYGGNDVKVLFVILENFCEFFVLEIFMNISFFLEILLLFDDLNNQVMFFGDNSNLHTTWDSLMIDRYCNGDWEGMVDEVSVYVFCIFVCD